MNNAFLDAALANDQFLSAIATKIGNSADFNKADTISQATGLLWYDLKPVVQFLHPYKELIPLISRLPRVEADGGNSFHWKRINAINVNNIGIGVSEGNRGARIAIAEQDQLASYKTLGLESSVTFEARLGSKNLSPEVLGINVQATLRSVMIGEEQTLLLGNSSLALGTTPTPTLAKAGTTGNWGGTVTVYVMCVALSGFGNLGYSTYNNVTNLGGVPSAITKVNADGSTDTYGGGSAKPSAEANIASVTTAQVVTASVAPVAGAIGYAWYVGTTSGAERLAKITAGNQVILTQNASATAQPVTNLQSSGLYQDNSTNSLVPDGILSQIFGNIFGGQYTTTMQTNNNLPSNVTVSLGGSLVYTMPTANTGLSISGTNIAEFDSLLQAAYDQYKLGYNRILMSSVDIAQFMGTMLAQSSTSLFRIMFEADQKTGRILAGRRVTSYLNKFFGNTLDIDIHPFIPPGTIVFWSDNIPYELSGVTNLLEAHVRQDYYQIQWPLKTRRYEYGVYADEVFACYFTPAFAAITNVNPSTGTPTF